MAYMVNKKLDEVVYAAQKAIRDLRVNGIGSSVHVDKTTLVMTGDHLNPTPATLTVSAANASDLATLLTLCAQIRAVAIAHAKDANAHKVADSTFLAAIPAEPTDLATAITFLNAVKAAYGTHIASTTFHYTADATNTIVAANASDQATSQTLANELKTDVTAHIAAALAGHGVAFW
jgi:hypothetical protein